MKKGLMSLLAALVVATGVVLSVTATPVRAETVQSADQVVSNPDATDVAADASGDSEWKYVPVRRYASADSSPSAFDGKLLTARDLTAEQH